MSHRNKALRLLVNVLLSLFRFALLTILIILIMGLVLLGFFQIIYAFGHLSWKNLQESLFLIVLGIVILASVPMLILKFFDDRPRVKRAIEQYRHWVHILFEFILAPLVAWGILAFLVIVIALAWQLLLSLFGHAVFSLTASWYLIGTLAILLFTLFAQGATQRVLRWIIGPPLELSWLINLLRPSLMRVYVYVLLALAYLLSTLENFAGIQMTDLMWWENFRSIIVEMLLTYVAIDGAFVAWRDHREEIMGKSKPVETSR